MVTNQIPLPPFAKGGQEEIIPSKGRPTKLQATYYSFSFFGFSGLLG
jgi:hypothetical protein